jgi:hypothetical protein
MRKKAILIFIILISLSPIYAIDYNFDRSSYILNDFTQNVEDKISYALNSTLVSYTKVDDALLNLLQIQLANISYKQDVLKVEGKIVYNGFQLPLDIEFQQSNKQLLFDTLENILIDTFRYDLSVLFETTPEYYLQYSDNTDSFLNKNNKYRVGDLIYLKNEGFKKSLAVVESIYNDFATINYLYNATSLVNTPILDGPKNQIGFNITYDYYKDIISFSGEYFYLKGLIYPFNTTYLGLSSSYYYNLDNLSCSFTVDSNLLLELPLSTLFKSVMILKNSCIYTKVKIGAIINENIEIHSAFELGYKQYLTSNLKIAVAYKRDSNNEIHNNVLISIEFLI